MNIAARIGAIGESPNFVAWNAHMFAAAFVLTRFSYGYPRWIACGIGLILAATKEFYFDLHYEKKPPQMFRDSALDFAGYLAGVLIAAIWP